jgi:hypothetical protein
MNSAEDVITNALNKIERKTLANIAGHKALSDRNTLVPTLASVIWL